MRFEMLSLIHRNSVLNEKASQNKGSNGTHQLDYSGLFLNSIFWPLCENAWFLLLFHLTNSFLQPQDFWIKAPKKGIVVFALPGEPGLTELVGDFKVHFHENQGDFYWFLDCLFLLILFLLVTYDQIIPVRIFFYPSAFVFKLFIFLIFFSVG